MHVENLNGRIALVTGGGRGLREATAMQLSDAGASVVLMSHASRGIVEEADAIEHRGGQALAIEANLANSTDLVRACNEISHRLGTVEILMKAVMLLSRLSNVLAVGELLERKLRPGFLSVVARRTSDEYEGRTMIQMMEEERDAELLDLTERGFDWTATA